MRKTATNAQIAMFPKSTIQRESRQRGSDFRIWENTIGRTLHHFARSCLKSERGLSRVSIGLLFDVLYLLVLFWTCLIFLFASQFHRSSFEDIQSDPRLEELSARLKENPGCTHDLPEYPAWTSNLHEFSWFHEWKAKQNTDVPSPGDAENRCSRRALCTLYIFTSLYTFAHLWSSSATSSYHNYLSINFCLLVFFGIFSFFSGQGSRQLKRQERANATIAFVSDCVSSSCISYTITELRMPFL